MRQTAAFLFFLLQLPGGGARATFSGFDRPYEHKETLELVALTNDAAKEVQAKGEAAFPELRRPGSRWRRKDTYIFVLDPEGGMLVHPDPDMEGKNEIGLKDVNGKPIIRGLIDAATALPDKPEGWYHYEWPVPGEMLPRWKSSFVRLVAAPDGKRYIVGSGVYNDRMERSFVVDLVKDAAGRIGKDGAAAFPLFHDPKGPFIAKDAYIFVIDPGGVELVNPAFPNLEGRAILDLKDAQGKPLVREMLEVARTAGSGWVDYMWPKPGESVPTRKSAFVTKARSGDRWLLVGCGVYLPGAPKAARPAEKMTAPELTALVRDAAAVFGREGEKAYPEFRKKGSKWFRDGTYFFVLDTNGTRAFHAADPSLEGKNVGDARDAHGRPYGRMFLEIGESPSGEGWAHYMYPEPGSLFPAWKSVFLKRVAFPSGGERIIGCGVYDMRMDKSFITDAVDRAAALIAKKGRDAFDELRDKKGPFFFADTYVFVDRPDGTELVNPAQPSLEGKNIGRLKDLTGKTVAKDYISAAMKEGRAWVKYTWYRPGSNAPARKQAYVRKVESGGETYIVGSGLYTD